MEDKDIFTDTIIEWAATRRDEIVFEPSKGFYSYDIVVDAYNRGKENATKEAKDELTEKMRSLYFKNAKYSTEAAKSILTLLSTNNFTACKLFVNITVESSLILVSLNEKSYNDEKFIDIAYGAASRMQTEYHDKGINMQINFLVDSDKINIDHLREDGFDIAFDFATSKQIY